MTRHNFERTKPARSAASSAAQKISRSAYDSTAFSPLLALCRTTTINRNRRGASVRPSPECQPC